MGRKNGKPPAPLELKAITGGRKSDLQRRVGEGVKMTPGIPVPPDWFDDEALAEWERLVEELDPYGLVSLADRGLLALMCDSWSEYVAARKDVQAHGRTNEHGQASPALTSMNRALNAYYKIATEFGMSPSSRSRVAIEPKKKSSNRWATKDKA